MRTFTLTGHSSILTANYFPPIYLKNDVEYEIAFLSMETFNAIPNVDEKNNKLYIGTFPPIEIPTGNYDLDDLAKFFNLHINENNDDYKDVFISLQANSNTLSSMIKCSHDLDFSEKRTDSIHPLLGFKNQTIKKGQKYRASDNPVNIFRVNTIRVDCNIVTGSYQNDKLGHTLHAFFPLVPPGFKIVESPQNLIYLPINTNIIDHIKIEILDQNENYVNFKQEAVTIRLHLKEVKNGY